MKFPVQITSRHFPLSEGMKRHILEKVSKLEMTDPRITRLHVILDVEHSCSHRARLYDSRVCLTAPGVALTVSGFGRDFYEAVDASFDAGWRRLSDRTGHRRATRRKKISGLDIEVQKGFQ